MKYIFLLLLCFAAGYFLPTFTFLLQVVLGAAALALAVGAVLYAIDKYVNAVRP